MTKKNLVYLDYAATTPLDSAVEKAMRPYWAEKFANPSSLHTPGQIAARAVLAATVKVASFLDCQPSEVIFTSGATEANNLALQGLVQPLLDRGQQAHIIISSLEHASVAEVASALVRRGAKVTVVRASQHGYISPQDVLGAVRDETVIVSIVSVCSETGTIQPLVSIGRQLETLNRRRKIRDLASVLLHTDAVQAAPWLSCKVNDLGVDLLSISGHKIYGPKGIGALYVRTGVQLQPLLYGGHQQDSLRPGTLNVPGIVGLGAAVDALATSKQVRRLQQVKMLRSILAPQLQSLGFQITGLTNRTSPGHLHIRKPGLPADILLTALELAGVWVSAGSACNAGSIVASPALLSMGWTPRQASEAIRISLGRGTKTTDLTAVVTALLHLGTIVPSSLRKR